MNDQKKPVPNPPPARSVKNLLLDAGPRFELPLRKRGLLRRRPPLKFK